MDQVKIGKLIAMLRKQKGLTQGELGEKVGVGDGAVSKWERGTTCPDISIINILSKTLGITSDELLTGELNQETKRKLLHQKSLKTILIPIIIISIIALAAILIIIKSNSNTYRLRSENTKYTVNGRVTFNKNKVTLQIDELILNDKLINEVVAKNYEYKIKCNNIIIFKTGNVEYENLLNNEITISKLIQELKINYSEPIPIKKSEIVNNGLSLNITLVTTDDKMLNQDIKIKLVK